MEGGRDGGRSGRGSEEAVRRRRAADKSGLREQTWETEGEDEEDGAKMDGEVEGMMGRKPSQDGRDRGG